MIKHFVEFFSPGTFISETSEKPIDSWDVKKATKMAKNISERYGAKPYGFRFRTKVTAEKVVVDGEALDVVPKIKESSGMFFINGRVLTLDDIPDTKENNILRSNMRSNNWNAVVETTNSYRHTAPFEKDDVCVDSNGNITVRGSDYYE